MSHRERLAAAKDFHLLAGLTVVPIGAGLVAQGTTWAPYAPGLGLAGSGLVAWWYARRFGVSRMTTTDRLRAALAVVVLLVALATAFVIDAKQIEAALAGQNLLPTVLLAPLLTGAGLYLQFRLGLPHAGITWLHRAVAIGVAAASLTPLLIEPHIFWFGYQVWAVSTGLGLIITGLYDHSRLLHTMPPVAEDPAALA